MKIGVVGIVGAGQMGMGIAQVAAMSGLEVIVQDLSSESILKGKTKAEQSVAKLVQKGTISEDIASRVKKQISGTQHLEDLSRADIVIEAITENNQIKYDLFKKLDSICRDEVILASNTSSISITQIAAQTRRPEKIIGMHFMNPVPLMKLVELIKGLRTSDETFNLVKNLGQSLGKVCVESKDYPGFIVNRILMPMINEACFALYEGLASIEDIDSSMKLGTNQPMGPFTLADFIGLDTCLSILNVLHEGLGDPKYRPCPLLKKYVAAGYLGKKVGRGFYTYEGK